MDTPGINAVNVAKFFRDHVPGGDVPLELGLISGGRSNLTYTVRGGDRIWVLRRPPLGHVLPTAHDMAREYRVLAALADTPTRMGPNGEPSQPVTPPVIRTVTVRP